MIKKSLEYIGERVFIALGANLGEPLNQIDMAVLKISEQAGKCIAMSKVYLSKPHGPKWQPDYVNSVLEIKTTLSPNLLLEILKKIENDLGRKKNIRWGPRVIDLDIILFADLQINNRELTIPHPRAHEREFVIKPLADLDRSLYIPPFGKVEEILDTLPINTLEIIRDVKAYHC